MLRVMTCVKPGETRGEISFDEAVRIIEDRPEALVWIDFQGSLTADDRERLASPPFLFHELALEDASKEDGQRPKVEEYDNHFFLVMHAVSALRSKKSIALDWHEIDLFVGKNYVVSVHREELPEVTRVWETAIQRPQMLQCGSDRLTHYLLDAVVDRYLEVVDEVEDVLDEVEEDVINPASDESAVHAVFRFKRQLIDFRKKANPLREAINEMTSRNFPFIKQETSYYLRDVYDHLFRLSDMLDAYRDILNSALDVHLSAASNRLNEIMKRLTVVATIFMPLTFITGFWGMNFVHLPFGHIVWFWGSVIGMGVVAAVMMAIFHSRKYK